MPHTHIVLRKRKAVFPRFSVILREEEYPAAQVLENVHLKGRVSSRECIKRERKKAVPEVASMS